MSHVSGRRAGRRARGLGVRLVAVLLATAAWPVAAQAPGAPVAASQGRIRSLSVRGNERLEVETVLSYTDLAPGQAYDRERLDRALKDLFASELFADVRIRDDGQGNLVIEIRENPVVNRVLVEGAKRVKEDKIREEIRIAPRQIYTRSRVRSDVARILELYRRSGRFAARVEPKIVQLEQNRVDVVFEISEGPKSNIRQINIVGNERFSDRKLRGEMATRQARPLRIFTSRDTYDPDRLAFDQQKLRQFYLTQGYADFRVVSAIAELTPDRRDFIVTYVVEEGERYRFGEVDLVSQLRDVKAEDFKRLLPMKPGDWYNAKQIEDTIDSLTNAIGLLGYAFADIRPQFRRDRDKREMNVTFLVNETPRVYVESVNIRGNTITRDEVVRREFRLAEGDAFNSVRVRRSRDRIQSLGFFQEKLEIEQKPGAAPDQVTLEVNLEERPTGSIQVSAGYSTLEGLILNFAIQQRNFRGRAQNLRFGVNWSRWSRGIDIGFTEPYVGGRNVALGVDVFRRDFRSFRFGAAGEQFDTFRQTTTGFQARTGFPVTEYWSASVRYGFTFDDVTIDENLYFTDGRCDPIKAGRYICDALGRYRTSLLGYTLSYSTLDNVLNPSRGQRLAISQDLAGPGGTVRYLRTRVNYDRYWNVWRGFILNVGGEAGNIFSLDNQEIRLTDRFFLGEPRFRGFDIRGVGPRVIRKPLLADGTPNEDPDTWLNDSVGGRNYYLGRIELIVPLGATGAELGIRPSAYVDVGSLWASNPGSLLFCPNIPATGPVPPGCPDAEGSVGFREFYVGDTWKPRISVGVGVNWNSPFGPFRIDIARPLKKSTGDQEQLFTFNVGTAF
ncbi:MAG: outer membrane protein assembly factor BamA [Sphingomonadaceae bacterium]|uniref:outer membrane protein assembly factor BamA n=1 Tax=Thermaurantiacus sp. TaxID=2820283 RepID=UPI00298F051D|nr:outer membrane protein assembly factor BamA [Thermaurantiacus sp.]MCS6986545.1 outer membrane protein assembly factor BamA [Sphingomonadaceae bacterium]MDW8414194.1 outer membrane protein assembly factor BamA [Thermaurantiacus sp.]